MTHPTVLPALVGQAFTEYVSIHEVVRSTRLAFYSVQNTITANPIQSAVVVAVALIGVWVLLRSMA